MIRPLVDALHAGGRPRVWSIVITIFGDVTPHRDWRIAMSDLQALMEPMGIGGGALRTAMSRLAAEGWVEREKEGRNAFYALAPARRAEVAQAGETIYALRPIEKTGWAIAIDPAPPEEPGGASRLARNVRLIPAAEMTREWRADRLVIRGEAALTPSWAEETLLPPDSAAGFADLAQVLDGVFDNGSALRALPPRDAMIARVLLVHFWRRLRLRHPFLPEDFVPATWPIHDAHRLTRRLYDCVIAQSEAWWPEKTPRATVKDLRRRFGIDP